MKITVSERNMNMNTFMKELKKETNYTLTENGAVTHKSTLNAVYDMFALGGAYRYRPDADCITLFKKAFKEDKDLALKCLFYLRDCRGGQGERRFFRVCYKWLIEEDPLTASSLLEEIPEYGRWDDLIYIVYKTPLEKDGFNIIKRQLALDIQCKTPSLLGKWMPSENASSKQTKEIANAIRSYCNMTHREYRKILSELRKRINVLERLMSANRWTEIEFDKIPSKAGLIYKNAFAHKEVIAAKYAAFAADKTKKVNASVLYPHDIAKNVFRQYVIGESERQMLQKYWDNLPNYYGNRTENGIAVVDTSGSMSGQPMEAAISMGAYIAEKAHGPFANHFITFSSHPDLIEFEGRDIVDKFNNCRRADWGMNTNIVAVFNLLLTTAKQKNVKKEDMPTRLYIFSDMEFDQCITTASVIPSTAWGWSRAPHINRNEINTLIEDIKKKWEAEGYDFPEIVFWNLNARQNNIPAIGDGFSYVSGFSPVMIEGVLSGKTSIDLMLDKLLSSRYAPIKGLSF